MLPSKCPGPVLKPLASNLRPLSAASILHTQPILRRNKFGTLKNIWKHPNNLISEAVHTVDVRDKGKRRLSLNAVLGSQPIGLITSSQLHNDQASYNVKLEDIIDLSSLERMEAAFQSACYNRTERMTLNEFKQILLETIEIPTKNDDEIDILFVKIDWSNQGTISWEEFCNYILMQYQKKAQTIEKLREVNFELPAKKESTPHTEEVVNVISTMDGSFIAASMDGVFSFWTNSLELKKLRSIATSTDADDLFKAKWVTYFLLITEFNKFVICTGNHELKFFEQSTLEVICRIANLDSMPITMNYFIESHQCEEVAIIWGDRSGCVNIYSISRLLDLLRRWKKCPKVEGIPTVLFEETIKQPEVSFYRWKVHKQWTLETKYASSLRQIISCSSHEATALIIGSVKGSTSVRTIMESRHSQELSSDSRNNLSLSISTSSNPTLPIQNKNTLEMKLAAPSSKHLSPLVQPKSRLSTDQRVFRVYKGVRTFVFCAKRNILATAGLDRIVRLWNPYVNTKPIGFLRGHGAPLVSLQLDEGDGRLFSISSDLSVKVWDIQDHSCLLTISSKSTKISGELQACHYSSVSKSLFIATDHVALLSIPQKPIIPSLVPLSHNEPVLCCLYNEIFNQIISAGENSTIRIWDVSSGQLIDEFTSSHGSEAITSMCFDSNGRRLITGGQDGLVRVWNYHNGHLLQTLKRKDNWSSELTSVEYIEMHQNRFIICSGWDRRMNVFIDNVVDDVHAIQTNLPLWSDDIDNGHVEDVSCLATSPPSFLASADYSGEIIVWNLVSGHILCKLNAPYPIMNNKNNNTSCKSGDDVIKEESRRSKSATFAQRTSHNLLRRNTFTPSAKMSLKANSRVVERRTSLDTSEKTINHILFLKSRAHSREAATLISSGPCGMIHMWCVYQNGQLLSRFFGSQNHKMVLQRLALGQYNNHEDGILFVTDNIGFVSGWIIHDYAMKQEEINCPPLYSRWRAHISIITSIVTISTHQLVATCSVDSSIRLWTYQGHYIGTFGQSQMWNTANISTYQHPMVPYDVLFDPQSLPDSQHPLIVRGKRQLHKDREAALLRISEEKKKSKETVVGGQVNENDMKQNRLPSIHDFPKGGMSDEDIAILIRTAAYNIGNGKRLRHERNKINHSQRHYESQFYQTLPCYDLVEVHPPTLNENFPFI